MRDGDEFCYNAFLFHLLCVSASCSKPISISYSVLVGL